MFSFGHSKAQSDSKPRIIITADPELDDNNSMIRFLLYSSDVQIEGLIYASSQFHWKRKVKARNGLCLGENMIDLA